MSVGNKFNHLKFSKEKKLLIVLTDGFSLPEYYT